ncbi:MAG: enoyl-CoA hydratase-related protein [Litorilinea sp.]
MNYEFVHYEKRERVAHITLNRPAVLNALHPPLVAELDAIWLDFMADDALWVAILSGAGERAFCAGTDLKYRATQADEETLRRPTRVESHVLDQCWKPIIVAVNGFAVGGGLELALCGDIILAADHAQLGLPEARRGLLADGGGVLNLPRRIPYHLAMSMILTGKFISAQEAHQFGLVNQVVPLNELAATAQAWADAVLECAPLALQAAKQAIVKTQDMPLEQAMHTLESLTAVRRLRDSADYTEGPRAFAEKRKPVWTGT